MKVSELITHLQQANPNAEVLIEDWEEPVFAEVVQVDTTRHTNRVILVQSEATKE